MTRLSPRVLRTDDAGNRKTVQRFDFAGELREPVVRPDGSLLCEGIAIAAGVLEYKTGDGKTFRELVTMDMLERTSGGLARIGLTLEHPGGGTVMVNADNAAEYVVGDVDGTIDVVREKDDENGFVRVRNCIRRSDAIQAVQSGEKKGMSCGYEATLDMTPGEHPVFGKYDAVQVDRIYNHLAIVGNPRSATANLRADGAAQVLPAQPADTPPNTENNVDLHALLLRLAAAAGVTRLDAADPELVAQVMAALEEMKAENADLATKNADMEAAKADMEKKVADLGADIEAKTGERDALKAELDAMKAAEAEAADKADMERVDGIAKKLDVDVSKCDSLKAKKVAIVQARGLKVDNADDITDARLDGMFDAIVAVADKPRSKWDSFKPERDDKVDSARTDSTGDRFGHPYAN